MLRRILSIVHMVPPRFYTSGSGIPPSTKSCHLLLPCRFGEKQCILISILSHYGEFCQHGTINQFPVPLMPYSSAYTGSRNTYPAYSRILPHSKTAGSSLLCYSIERNLQKKKQYFSKYRFFLNIHYPKTLNQKIQKSVHICQSFLNTVLEQDGYYQILQCFNRPDL